jgi:hypothetical protein
MPFGRDQRWPLDGVEWTRFRWKASPPPAPTVNGQVFNTWLRHFHIEHRAIRAGRQRIRQFNSPIRMSHAAGCLCEILIRR